MGVPISPKNIFPSNIQGLPTWYEVRVSESGFLGRRGGIDIMVSMNPQSMPRDIAEVDKGGYLSMIRPNRLILNYSEMILILSDYPSPLPAVTCMKIRANDSFFVTSCMWALCVPYSIWILRFLNNSSVINLKEKKN